MTPSDQKQVFGNVKFGQARNGFVVCDLQFELDQGELSKDPKDRDLRKGQAYVIVCKCDDTGTRVPVTLHRNLVVDAKIEGTQEVVKQVIKQEYTAEPYWANLYDAKAGKGGVQAYTIEEYCAKFKVAEKDKPEYLQKVTNVQ